MSKFKIGDRVAVYGEILGVKSPADRKLGTVAAVAKDGDLRVRFEEEFDGDREWYVHPKQCRRLKPKAKPREWELMGTAEPNLISSSYTHRPAISGPKLEPGERVRVREVKDE
jgi:hypothetical protein